VPKKESEKESITVSFIRAFIITPLIFLIILASIFAYSGVWPPLVVIESESMQHSDTTSYIGTIDTGDIVVVKGIDSFDEVVTYVEGIASGHYTYGEAGDVIIYHHSGMSKPIIHRAIVNLVYNYTGGGFDIPSLANLPADMWEVPGENVWWNLKKSVVLNDVGYANTTVQIDLETMLFYMSQRGEMHGGLITLGDHNWDVDENGNVIGKYDQKWIRSVQEPIREEWLIGKARGELPWFGLLKLWANGAVPANTPHNSEINLFVTLGLIFIIPMILDVGHSSLKRRGIEPFKQTKRIFSRHRDGRRREK